MKSLRSSSVLLLLAGIVLAAPSTRRIRLSKRPASRSSKEPGLLSTFPAITASKPTTPPVVPEPNYLGRRQNPARRSQGVLPPMRRQPAALLWAPGNIYAQRGTLDFDWRPARTSTRQNPIFRVGYADHSSWDMLAPHRLQRPTLRRLVTDAEPGRTRVPTPCPNFPSPTCGSTSLSPGTRQRHPLLRQWKTRRRGRRHRAVLTTASTQFGPQRALIARRRRVHYSSTAAGDLDELRIYDRMLSDGQRRRLARHESRKTPAPHPFHRRTSPDPARQGFRARRKLQQEWLAPLGWNRPDTIPALPPPRKLRSAKSRFTMPTTSSAGGGRD